MAAVSTVRPAASDAVASLAAFDTASTLASECRRPRCRRHSAPAGSHARWWPRRQWQLGALPSAPAETRLAQSAGRQRPNKQPLRPLCALSAGQTPSRKRWREPCHATRERPHVPCPSTLGCRSPPGAVAQARGGRAREVGDAGGKRPSADRDCQSSAISVSLS